MASRDRIDGVTGEKRAPRKAAKAAMEDPQHQVEVLSPRKLAFTLELESGKHLIEVPAELSLGDILQRRVNEDVDAYCKLLFAELYRMAPDLQNHSVSVVFDNTAYLGSAMARSNVRDVLRELVCKMATFAEPFTEKIGNIERPRTKPRLDEIEAGMRAVDLQTFGVFLLRRWIEQRAEDQKNSARTT